MSTLALVAALAVIAVPVLAVFAVLGHVAMKPVRKTAFGEWAGMRAEARMDRVRAAFTARKRTKAGAP